jgi:threonine/homoserine/homoserine lactone efflux protein
MEEIHLALRGMLLGFAIAAPVGPIGVLVIRRTLAVGPRAGLVSGLGAATADAGYGLVAVLGLAVVTRPLLAHADLLRLAGGVFLCAFGVHTFLASPARSAATDAPIGRLWSAYLSTLALTVTNPLTILSFAAAFAGLGLLATNGRGAGAGIILVIAVFLGSAFWWLLLSSGVGLLRGRLGVAALRAINWISGLLLVGFGLLAVLASKR